MKKQLLLFLMMFLPMLASADAVEIDGLYYNLIEKAGCAEVTRKPNNGQYSGSVVIPESVVYEGNNYSVTSIRENAFYGCNGLTSVTIGNNVTSIGYGAFVYCSGLTSVHITDIAAWCNISFGDYYSNPLTSAHHLYLNGEEVKDLVIPNSVTSIGGAFSGCSSLTSVTIPNSVTTIGEHAFSYCSGLTSVTIPNSVTSIGDYAFYGCSGLTSVTIPNSVTTIGEHAFSYCSGLTSVTIPNSVTSIGYGPFEGCSGLTSINVESGNPNYDSRDNCNAIIETSSNTLIVGCKNTIIPNSVTSIGYGAFWGCIGLTSVTIPNSVTIIGESAFHGCSGLASVTIGNSVTSIGGYAFSGCSAIQFVKSIITEPYSIKKNVFPDEIYRQGTLFIPAGTERLYSRYDGWREFLKIVEMDGTETPDIPGADKCATPTISYQFGQLSFSCETEDVTFVSEIKDYDIKKSYDASLYLTATYYISVYATKDGYNNSDVATATLSWMDAELYTDDISGGAATVRAKAVLIQSNGSMLSIAGADEGTAISVYDVSGKMVGSATVASENTNISTSLRPGDIGFVKIGEKTIKIIIN